MNYLFLKLKARTLLILTMFALMGCVETLPNKIINKPPGDLNTVTQESRAVSANSSTSSNDNQIKQSSATYPISKLASMQLLIKDGDFEKAKFCTASNSVIKRIDAKGMVSLKSGKSFRLKLSKDDDIESIMFTSDDSNLTIAFASSSGGDGDAYVCKYQLSNLKRLWCTQVFTAYEGYFSNAGAIYIVGYDMISKIDMNTGKSLWTVPGLTSSKQFESSYVTPFEDSSNITFVSTIGSGPTARKFVFNNKNGKMISKQIVPVKAYIADLPKIIEGKCNK